ncbi:hypothetical protein ACCT07_36755 [Rhizobium johnstonii]|uniref:hypothetical protein n=1 Tax=Rhizobium johnstonii TaxID=3019933 RepID=UPI003F9C168A
MANPTDPEHLRNVTQELIKAITSPEVIEQMREFRDKAAAGGDFVDAGNLMSLENLKANGADLPDGFRITSRIFEDKNSGKIINLGPEIPFDPQNPIPFDPHNPEIPFDPQKGGFNPVGMSGCAGGGAATVCACAGGGT